MSTEQANSLDPIESHFKRLRKINVNKKVETKGAFKYLSWSYAVDRLLREDPTATWSFSEPAAFGNTLMVFCSVTAFGKTMNMQLPVMDSRNKAIANPDAFAVNKAMMRCLAKCIALFGIGLYLFAGEDLPDARDAENVSAAPAAAPGGPKTEAKKIEPFEAKKEPFEAKKEPTYVFEMPDTWQSLTEPSEIKSFYNEARKAGATNDDLRPVMKHLKKIEAGQ